MLHDVYIFTKLAQKLTALAAHVNSFSSFWLAMVSTGNQGAGSADLTRIRQWLIPLSSGRLFQVLKSSIALQSLFRSKSFVNEGLSSCRVHAAKSRYCLPFCFA